MPNFPLSQLPRTDVWYKCWEMRDDLRFTYGFLPKGKADEGDARRLARTDPLNPHRMEVAYDDGVAPMEFSIAASQYKASPRLALRFFLEEGRLEDVSREGPTGLTANRHFVEILKSKGYPTSYEEVGGSHEPVHWRGALAEGVVALTK